jgi:hypothetical protein
MPTRGKNPPVLRPAPFGKGGHWGIFRRCFERGAAHFHLLCCTDWYMNYFAFLADYSLIFFGFAFVGPPLGDETAAKNP